MHNSKPIYTLYTLYIRTVTNKIFLNAKKINQTFPIFITIIIIISAILYSAPST